MYNSECKCIEPLADSLYPKNIYQCDECATCHGTRAYGGAVNWQCPRSLVANEQWHSASVHQEYRGFVCQRCQGAVIETLDEGIERIRRRRYPASAVPQTSQPA